MGDRVVPGPPGPPLLKFVEPFPGLVFFRQRVGDLRIDDGRWLARPAAAFTQVRLALLELGFLFLLGLDLLDKAGLALVQRGLALLEHGLLAFKFRAASSASPSVRSRSRSTRRASSRRRNFSHSTAGVEDRGHRPFPCSIDPVPPFQPEQPEQPDAGARLQVEIANQTRLPYRARQAPKFSGSSVLPTAPYSRSKRSSPLWSNRVKQLLGKGLDMR